MVIVVHRRKCYSVIKKDMVLVYTIIYMSLENIMMLNELSKAQKNKHCTTKYLEQQINGERNTKLTRVWERGRERHPAILGVPVQNDRTLLRWEELLADDGCWGSGCQCSLKVRLTPGATLV